MKVGKMPYSGFVKSLERWVDRILPISLVTIVAMVLSGGFRIKKIWY